MQVSTPTAAKFHGEFHGASNPPFLHHCYEDTENSELEHGHAFLELAIILPIILIAIFMLTELGFLYNSREEVGIMSREAAYAAYRVCAVGKSSSTIPGCLQNIIHDQIEDIAQNTIKNFYVPPQASLSNPAVDYRGAVIISAFEYDNLRAEWRRVALDKIGNPSFNSRFGEFPSSAQIAVGADAPDLLRWYKKIVIAEVFYKFEAVTPLLNIGKAVGTTMGMPSEFYDATIM